MRIGAAWRSVLVAVLLLHVLTILTSNRSAAQQVESLTSAVALRRQAVLQYFAEGAGITSQPLLQGIASGAASLENVGAGSSLAMAVVAARLASQERLDLAFTTYAAQLRKPHRELHHRFALIAAYLHGREVLPDSVKFLAQRHFAVYPMARGHGELDWHLYYSTLLLSAQAWPALPAEAWFNGKSSAQNHREASEYLEQWMQRVATQGQSEFDSPAYLSSFLAPLMLLYDFVKDEELRQRSRMIIDLLLADFAAEHLAGHYAGGHSRLPAPLNLAPSRSQAAGLAWMLFGAGEMTAAGIGADLLFAALSSYEVPEVVLGMGINRNQTYVHRERKAHAALYRRHLARDDVRAVQKYTYVTRDYAIGSLTGAIHHPYEQQSWCISHSAGDHHPLFFVTHPYAGDQTLGMFFPDPPPVLAKDMAAQQAGSPEKLYGASPFEKVLQHRNVLIALYDIPASAANPRINAFLSKNATVHERGDSGWILSQAGRTFLAVRFLRPVTWHEIPEGWQLVSYGRRNAVIVEVSSVDDFPDLEKFKERLGETEIDSKQIIAAARSGSANSAAVVNGMVLAEEQFSGAAKLTYTSSYGDVFEISSSGERKLNGYSLTSGRWPLFDGPFTKADERQRTLLLHSNKLWRQLNFATWEISDVDASFGEDLTRNR